MKYFYLFSVLYKLKSPWCSNQIPSNAYVECVTCVFNLIYLIIKSFKYVCFLVPYTFALHIDYALPDGTCELVPESESEQREADANLIEVAEDPNEVRKSPSQVL